MNELSLYTPAERSGSDHATPSMSVRSHELLDDEVTGLQALKYWYLMRKHQWLLLSSLVVGLSLATYAAFTATPIYTATSVLLIKPKIPNMLGPKDIAAELGPEEGYSTSYYKTQYAILNSRSLAAKVILTLGLARDRRFLGLTKRPSALARIGASALWPFGPDRLRGSLAVLIPHQSGPPTASQPSAGTNSRAGANRPSEEASRMQSALIDEYLSAISVMPVPDTSLVDIRVSTSDPTLSTEIANAHAQSYEQLGISLHDQAQEEIENFLRTKLDGLRRGLEVSETRLNTYRRENGLIPGLTSLDGKQTVLLDRLADLSKELTAAQVDRIALEAQVQLVSKGQYASLPAVVNNGNIQALQSALNGESAELASLSSRFTSDYPPLAQVQAKVRATEARLREEIRTILDSIQSGYRVALGKEMALRNEVDSQKQEVFRLNDAAVEYAMLQREVDTNRDLVNQVLQRMKDVSLEAESDTSNAIILDRAEEPRVRTSPRRFHEIAEGGFFGLGLGIVIALSAEYMRDTLGSPEEMERYLRLPNLGVVPEFSVIGKDSVSAELSGHSEGMQGVSTGDSGGLVCCLKSYSIATEGYRSVRTGLLLSRAGAPPRLTLMTSAIRGEGKTLTVINTAIMLAEAGARVLVIDADLRRGRCASVLGIEKSPGLTEYLIGALPAEKAITRNGIERLALLPAGSRPPNATELVGSQRMRDLLEKMSHAYDFVVVDSPPIVAVSDALVLSAMVDGVVLVIDSKRTPKNQVRLARARLEYARAKVFGFVINRMHPFSPHYYYSYYSYYDKDYDGESQVG